MANGGTTKTADLIRWQIEGVRQDIAKTQERLTYLQNEERRLTGQALTGTSGTSKAKNGNKTQVRKRRRNISPETRAKMAAGARKRWANRNAQNTTTASAGQSQDEQVPAPVVD